MPKDTKQSSLAPGFASWGSRVRTPSPPPLETEIPVAIECTWALPFDPNECDEVPPTSPELPKIRYSQPAKSETFRKCEWCQKTFLPRDSMAISRRFCSGNCQRTSWKVKSDAHARVALAIKTGELTREPCEKCNTLPSHAHHEDYSKPLDVTWLCHRHHRLRHSEIRREKKAREAGVNSLAVLCLRCSCVVESRCGVCTECGVAA